MQHVMRARPDVDKGKRPETDHRQPVRVKRRLGGLGNEVVTEGEAERGEDQAHRVVHVEPVQVRLVDARGEDGGEVAHEVDERGPEDRGQDVPQRDIHLLVLADGHRGEDIHPEHDPGDHHQDVEPQGQFCVLEALVEAQGESHHRAQDDADPQHQGGKTQPLAPQLHPAQPRYQVVDEAHVGGEEPAEEHPVGVHRAHAAVGEPRYGPEEGRVLELRSDHQGIDPGDHEEQTRRHQEPEGTLVFMGRHLGRSFNGFSAHETSRLPLLRWSWWWPARVWERPPLRSSGESLRVRSGRGCS